MPFFFCLSALKIFKSEEWESFEGPDGALPLPSGGKMPLHPSDCSSPPGPSNCPSFADVLPPFSFRLIFPFPREKRRNWHKFNCPRNVPKGAIVAPFARRPQQKHISIHLFIHLISGSAMAVPNSVTPRHWTAKKKMNEQKNECQKKKTYFTQKIGPFDPIGHIQRGYWLIIDDDDIPTR